METRLLNDLLPVTQALRRPDAKVIGSDQEKEDEPSTVFWGALRILRGIGIAVV